MWMYFVDLIIFLKLSFIIHYLSELFLSICCEYVYL